MVPSFESHINRESRIGSKNKHVIFLFGIPKENLTVPGFLKDYSQMKYLIEGGRVFK